MNPRESAISAYLRRDYTAATQFAEAYLAGSPDDADLINVAASAHYQLGSIDEATRLYSNLASKGQDARALVGLARIQFANGDTKESAELLLKALHLDQTNADAWNLLSMAHKFSKGDALVAKAKKLLTSKPNDKHLVRELCYALSKAMNDIQHWDRAWTYAEAGAEAVAPNYNPNHLSNAVAAQKRYVTEAVLGDTGAMQQLEFTPVFIVGMPRSGTTLVERILEAHPDADSFGEADAMPRLVNAASTNHAQRSGIKTAPHQWMSSARPEDHASIGEAYTRAVGGDASAGRFTIDKMPGNLLLCGAIKMALPKAKIIWVRRDPLDTCVSCFLSRFGAGHHYSYRLDWLGRAFRDYEASGEHYAKLLPDSMMELKYETLATDPEAEIRRLLKFVGLPWRDECLSPEGVSSTSLTLSSEQVKSPINTSAIGRWQRYKRRVGPLAEALELPI